MVKIPSFQCRGCGFNPWWRNEDSTCLLAKKKKKKIICHKKENKTKQQQQQKGNSPLFVLSMKVKVIQSCLTLCDPMDCGLPGSPVHGIYQARILEWVAFPFSRGSSQPKDQTHISCIAGGFFTIWATKTPGTVSRDPLTVALQVYRWRLMLSGIWP